MPEKLLLADDSVTVQRVIELTFADEGMTVVAVGDGRQAIERIEQSPPDIVLADVNMPERDGYEVAAHLKRTPHLAHIPVVLMTGAFEQIDEARARAVGCDGVLAKPFEPHMVISLVRQLLGKPGPGLDAAAAGGGAASGYPFDAAAVPATTPSLDDYFDRLDEALTAQQPARDAAEGRGDVTPAAMPKPATGTPAAASGGGASASRASLADAFAALLADELGETPPPSAPGWQPPVVAGPGPEWGANASGPDTAPVLSSGAPGVVTDALVDEITRRVIERIGDRVVRDVVATTVLDLAERLVRDEIERIKAQA